MKILYKTEYFGRILFVLDINDKVTLVYKSSGLSGTGHKSQILPFMYLNEGTRFRDVTGYIFKEMFYKGCYTLHGKQPERFEKVSKKLNTIQGFLENETSEVINIKYENREELIVFVSKINTKLHKYTDNKKMFDWYLDTI